MTASAPCGGRLSPPRNFHRQVQPPRGLGICRAFPEKTLTTPRVGGIILNRCINKADLLPKGEIWAEKSTAVHNPRQKRPGAEMDEFRKGDATPCVEKDLH